MARRGPSKQSAFAGAPLDGAAVADEPESPRPPGVPASVKHSFQQRAWNRAPETPKKAKKLAQAKLATMGLAALPCAPLPSRRRTISVFFRVNSEEERMLDELAAHHVAGRSAVLRKLVREAHAAVMAPVKKAIEEHVFSAAAQAVVEARFLELRDELLARVRKTEKGEEE